LEEEALAAALAKQIEHFRHRGQWERLQCAELLFVRGWSNKTVASRLGIAEQTVANYKFEFLARLRSAHAISSRLGDQRRVTDALSLLVPALGLHGRLGEAMDLSATHVETCRQNALPRNLCEALVQRIGLRLVAADEAGAAGDLRELDDTLKSHAGLLDGYLDIGRKAARTELALRRGDGAAALAAAREAMDVGARYQPNFFSSLAAFAGPAEALVEIRDRALPGAADVTDRLVRTACGVAARFAGIFPIGVQAQASYTVSVCDTVVEPFPVSASTVRPNPSRVFLLHRPFVVAVTVHGAEVAYV